MGSADRDFDARRWAIVGAGRVGRTLGLLANRLGIPIASTWNRSADAARATDELLGPVRALHGPAEQCASALLEDADVVWVTTIDSTIADVAGALAPHLRAHQLVLHAAGSLSSQVLSEAGIRVPVGSLHPLQAITDPETAVEALSDVAWTVEGASEAVEFARELMGRVGVEPVEIDSSKKTLYHASAVTTANLLVALMDAAFAMAEEAGMSREQARRLMLPLARSCVENLERQPTADALSGPAARGDQATIERHLEALRLLDDEQLARVYEVLTERAKRLATE